MKLLRVASGVFLYLLALSGQAFGQLALPTAVVAAHRQYAASFNSPPQLFNGPEYVDYARRYRAQIGHQFLATAEKQPGGVEYNGQYFGNLLLNYDVVFDQVVLSPPSSPLSLRLVNERVRSFALGGRHFVRVVADSATGGAIRTGFYEVLLDSAVQVLAKRSKSMQERVNQSSITVEFVPATRLFIKKGNAYYLINKKAAAMRLFSDRSRELQAYLKEQKLSFKKAQLEASVVQLAAYYSGLAPR